MQDKKPWVEPQIEEVPLEAEDEVLATCYTASMSERTSTGANCRSGKCNSFL